MITKICRMKKAVWIYLVMLVLPISLMAEDQEELPHDVIMCTPHFGTTFESAMIPYRFQKKITERMGPRTAVCPTNINLQLALPITTQSDSEGIVVVTVFGKERNSENIIPMIEEVEVDELNDEGEVERVSKSHMIHLGHLIGNRTSFKDVDSVCKNLFGNNVANSIPGFGTNDTDFLLTHVTCRLQLH